MGIPSRFNGIPSRFSSTSTNTFETPLVKKNYACGFATYPIN